MSDLLVLLKDCEAILDRIRREERRSKSDFGIDALAAASLLLGRLRLWIQAEADKA